MSLKDARAQKQAQYFTGKSCVNGHVSNRSTANRSCLRCQRVKDKERVATFRSSSRYTSVYHAKNRAKKGGIFYDLSVDQFTDSEFQGPCPMCGCVMVRAVGNKTHLSSSPTLDRIFPDRGYTRDNVVVICRACNDLKGSITPNNIHILTDFFNKLKG